MFVLKSLLTTFSNWMPLHLKQTFPSMIWIFTEGEGDGIESRLPYKIFSTLNDKYIPFRKKEFIKLNVNFCSFVNNKSAALNHHHYYTCRYRLQAKKCIFFSARCLAKLLCNISKCHPYKGQILTVLYHIFFITFFLIPLKTMPCANPGLILLLPNLFQSVKKMYINHVFCWIKRGFYFMLR